MTQDEYWMWLTSIEIFDTESIKLLLTYLKEPEAVWNASSKLLYAVKGLKEKYIFKILESRNDKYIEELRRKLYKYEIEYISAFNPRYPEKLKNIDNYPYGIYMKGKHINLEKKTMAIVGTRKCSEYGADVTQKLGYELALCGVEIVSGMAKGIDTQAHKGAIKSNNIEATCAVMGCGLDICYPKENEELMKNIIECGCIISEYPPNVRPNAVFFPRRNRIISGLSEGVLVVEAEKKSGSLITVEYALEQGKEVFAVPGNITSAISDGTNALIKQGACMVTDYEDILNEFNWEKNLEVYFGKKNNVEYTLAQEEKLVYDCISLEPQSLETFFVKIGLSIEKLQYYLVMLELKGLIRKMSGERYVRCEL